MQEIEDFDAFMIQDERHSHLLRTLASQEFVTVEEAVCLLRSSPATVRRDFTALAQAGLAERRRGGLRRLQVEDSGQLPFAFRAVRYSAEKAALARAAAGLLNVGDVVMVDGGTSTHHLAACLPDFPLTIITNSLRLAFSLGELQGRKHPPEVHLSGGLLQADSGLLVGPQTVVSLDGYHARWAFLSASALCEQGVYNTNTLVVDSERVMMRNADEVVLLADHSKLGAHALCRISAIDAVDRLITDRFPDTKKLLDTLRETGLRVQLVDL